MARDKEKSANPAAAHRKAEKQKALKKGKAAVAAQRNERLAHRNPNRLQAQIDELKALESSSGQLSTRDKKSLEDLEREIARVRKAKEALGDKYGERPHSRQPRQGDQNQTNPRQGNVLGKRVRLGARYQNSDSSDTEDDVRDIPMPRDTPPPLPSQRVSRDIIEMRGACVIQPRHGQGDMNTGLISTPQLPAAQTVTESKTVYESKPIVRNLLKEAATFLPNVVRKKVALSKGEVKGKYIEPEELDALEKEGYFVGSTGQLGLHEATIATSTNGQQVQIEEAED